GVRVDGGDVGGVPGQPLGPPAGAGGQFEHVAGGRERVEGVGDLGDVLLPVLPGLLVEGVPAFAAPPLVVLGGAMAVVVALLVQNVHADTVGGLAGWRRANCRWVLVERFAQ